MSADFQDHMEYILDGLALFQEHAPQSGEDWIKVAERCVESETDLSNASPLFAAVVELVRQRQRHEAIGYTVGTGRLFCKISVFQAWCERLLARRILSHEFADEELWDDLRVEFERLAKAAF